MDMTNPITEWATKHDVTLRTEFVPFSKSRHATAKKGEKPWRLLNWRVWLQVDGRDVVGPFDYSSGVAACPSYTQRETIDVKKAVDYEIEHGLAFAGSFRRGNGIHPAIEDVLYSLSGVAGVLTSNGFEDWCSDLGFDADSIKAKATYDACADIAFKMVRAFGFDGMTSLGAACEGY